MHNSENHKPPRLALSFFRWFCDTGCREDIEGDLVERFHERAASLGAEKARWLFIKDVLALFRPGIIRKLEDQTLYKFFIMNRMPWFKLAAINLLLVIMIISAFLPGPSNQLVQVLSISGQVVGVFGLLLVPISIAWIIIETRKKRNTDDNYKRSTGSLNLAIGVSVFICMFFLAWVIILPNLGVKIVGVPGLISLPLGLIFGMQAIKTWKVDKNYVPAQAASYLFAITATICATIIYTFCIVGAFAATKITAALAGLLLIPVGLYWAIKKIRKIKEDDDNKRVHAPYYLLSLPITALLTLIFLVNPAGDYSRDYAIKRSGQLITLVEDYKEKNGHYPASIAELESHYPETLPRPSIMGIRDFRYDRINDHYTISFSQWQDLGSAEEVVLYDKNDQHDIKGAFAAYDTKHSHWKYYLLD
jgi:hypothetical protein